MEHHQNLHGPKHSEFGSIYIRIYSDDIKAVGTTDRVLDAFGTKANTIWTLKSTDPKWALGLEEVPELDEQGNVKSLIHRMPPFVTSMANVFQEHLPKATVKTPYPEHSKLNKDTPVSEAEIIKFQLKGFRKAAGMALWSVRHAFDEQKFGISIICSVMSKGGQEAWDNLMHMIKWQLQHKDRGIRFNRDGNKEPIGFSDASNKPIVVSLGTVMAGFGPGILWP